MAVSSTDFLRFSPYSIKNLITRKLSENTKFTDQVYEGSNLAILIDIFSYMASQMLYSLNSAAAESMFSDTLYYENMNRLVKFIGYNPKGFIPSVCDMQVNVGSYDNIEIPIYSAVKTDLVDSQGKNVYYSLVKTIVAQNTSESGINSNTFTFYNGKWKMHNTVFTASGTKYETFILDGVQSDTLNNKFVANNQVHVYVQKNGRESFERWTLVEGEIFLNTTEKYNRDTGLQIYTSNDKVYSLRLNETKTYEIKFGNGTNGQMLEQGDKIYVFYLESNGKDAILQIGDVYNKKIIVGYESLGVTKEFFYNKLLALDLIEEELQAAGEDIENATVTNISQSTNALEEQDVDDIRETAPSFYKIGNRLITKNDYEYYIKNTFIDVISDVVCHNNWDYISLFYGWLYKNGTQGLYTEYAKDSKGIRPKDGRYYLNETKMLKYGYQYSDPADCNNVYLWVLNNTANSNSNSIYFTQIKKSIMNIKNITAEPVCLQPLTKMFMICAAPHKRVIKYFNQDSQFDLLGETYLEILVSDNNVYTNSSIQNQVNMTILSYFKPNNVKLGQLVDANVILNDIYNINGVERVRTVFSEVVEDGQQKTYEDRYIDGLCFASWTSDLIDSGDDLQITTSNIQLEPFQYPAFYSSSIIDRIKVIKRSFNTSGIAQY